MHADIAAAEAERRVYEEAEAEDARELRLECHGNTEPAEQTLRVSSMPSQPPLLWREIIQTSFRESQQSVSNAHSHQSNEAPPSAEQPLNPNASE